MEWNKKAPGLALPGSRLPKSRPRHRADTHILYALVGRLLMWATRNNRR